ncbi:MAG: PepSY domain-containing protein, partial [Pseudomonadota bacterium]
CDRRLLMNHEICGAMVLSIGALIAFPAHADHGHGGLEACLKAANAVRPGEFAKVEYLSVTDEGGPAYEIEVAATSGTNWEFECDEHGRIIEMEQEVESSDHPLFKKQMKVTEAAARATALRLYPGTVDEVEYEIEMNGDASYEFDVIDEFGVEFKIEIDATNGDVVEVQVEKWEIGIEDRED